jgi:hypothetical protein
LIANVFLPTIFSIILSFLYGVCVRCCFFR